MANVDKYSTIKQFQPLRVPKSFDQQGKTLIMQIEETFDDIYRRFGRLKVSDLGKELQDLCLVKDEDGKHVSINVALDGITTEISDELGNYYTKSETATEIQTRMTNALGDYYTKTETATEIQTKMTNALGDYYTKTETASKIQTDMTNKLGDYYTKTETASQIQSKITTALGDYSTTSQTASDISAAVADCYGKVSGITINSSGIEITGSKYIKLKSGNSLKIESGGTIDVNTNNFKLDSANKTMQAGNWTLDNNGISGKMNNNLYIRFGESLQCLCIASGISSESGWAGGNSGRFYLKPMKSPVHYPSVGESCISFGEEIEVGGHTGMIGEPNCRVTEVWVKGLCYEDFKPQSSRKVKKSIADMPFMGEILDALHPVVYRYKSDPDDRPLRYGLIYEEAVEVLPDITSIGTDNIGTVNYIELVCMLLQQVQDLRKRVAVLEAA